MTRKRRVTFAMSEPLRLSLDTFARFEGRSRADVLRHALAYYMRREIKRRRRND